MNLYDYCDYRTYLKDFAERKRAADSRWSYGVWAKQLKLKSSSTLVMVVNGQRNPGQDLTGTLSRYFAFNPEQAEYFESLVRLRKSKRDPRLTVLLMEKLATRQPHGKFAYLDQKAFAAISHWHYYAIRELVHVRGFKDDPVWIAHQLRKEVSPREARLALESLLELGLIVRGANGKYTQSSGHVDMNSPIADEGLSRFHEQALEKARRAVREIPRADREITAVSFAMKRENLPRARELMRNFRAQLCELLEEKNADGVFHLEMALTPWSRLPQSPGVNSELPNKKEEKI